MKRVGFIRWLRKQAHRAYKGDWVGDLADDFENEDGAERITSAHELAKHLDSKMYGVDNAKEALEMAWQEFTGDRHARVVPHELKDLTCSECEEAVTESASAKIIWEKLEAVRGFEGLKPFSLSTYGYLHTMCFARSWDSASVGAPWSSQFHQDDLEKFLSKQTASYWRELLPGGLWDALAAQWTTRPTQGAYAPLKHAGTQLSPSLRFAVLQRDSYRCRLCGASINDGSHIRLEIDHITPRSRGGTNDPSNLWTLCFDCNRGKGVKSL